MAVERLPPQNIEAERSVLGSLLIDPEGYTKISGALRPEDFYRHSHKRLYQAIQSLGERSEPPDWVTVCEELERMEALEEVGGEVYVSSVANDVPSAFHVEYYADIVRRAAVLREIIDGASRIASMAMTADAESTQVLDTAESIIFSIARQTDSREYVPIREVLTEFFDQLDFRNQHPGVLSGIPTNFETLNSLTGGFQRSDLVIVAARTGIGKTTFLLNVARNAARNNEVPVGIFTLELSAEQLVQRLVSLEARIDSRKLRDADLEDTDFQRIGRAIGELSESPIYIDDSPMLSIMQLRGKARRMQAEHNIGMIVLDYLQLMQGSRTENRVQEISEITRSLKGLARELNVPIVAGAQLSRAVEQRPESRPRLSDLRESGSIEQDADLVIFLYAETSDSTDAGPVNIVCDVAKHRNGPVGRLNLRFARNLGRFDEVKRSGF